MMNKRRSSSENPGIDKSSSVANGPLATELRYTLYFAILPPRRIWVEIVRKIRYNAVTAWGRRRVLYSGRKRETDMIPMLYADLIDDAGNRLRFEEIYETYCRQMFYKANSILRDEHEAEDAVHDAFIGIARNMKTVAAIANEQDLRYYVLRAAENAAYNRTRQTKHYAQAVPLENVPMCLTADFGTVCAPGWSTRRWWTSLPPCPAFTARCCTTTLCWSFPCRRWRRAWG